MIIVHEDMGEELSLPILRDLVREHVRVQWTESFTTKIYCSNS